MNEDNKVLADYEIFLKNGTSFTLTRVKNLDVTVVDKIVTELNIVGSEVRDTLVHLNISEIICIVKRNKYTITDSKPKWWSRDKNHR